MLAGKIPVSRMSPLQKEMFGDVLADFGEQRNVISVLILSDNCRYDLAPRVGQAAGSGNR